MSSEARVVHLNVVCGGLTTALVVSLLNPLDVLRIRLQTSTPGAKKPGLLSFARNEWRAHGVRLWWPGLGVNALSVAVSSGLRIGLYPAIRDYLVAITKVPEKHPPTLFVAGLLSGVCGFFLATPLFAAKIRAQMTSATETSLLSTLRTTWQRKPFSGASVLIVRGSLLSAGANAGYDLAKSNLRPVLPEGATMHVLSSVMAAFCATTLSAPADAIMTRFQASPAGMWTGPWSCARAMWAQDKASLFRGWGYFFLRVAPTWMLQMPLYERMRHFLGMGFQT